MKSFTPVDEKEFETAGLFIFGGLSLIMAILKLVNWNSTLAKPSRKGDKFFDHKRYSPMKPSSEKKLKDKNFAGPVHPCQSNGF